jgi:hypothetical protein
MRSRPRIGPFHWPNCNEENLMIISKRDAAAIADFRKLAVAVAKA